MQEIVIWLAQVLDAHPVPIFALLTALAMLATKKRVVLLLAVAATAALVPVAKEIYAEERPCVNGITDGACDGWGFPSAHTAVATVIAVGLLGTPWFFLALPLAFLVGYSRVLLNVHSFEQVAAGLAFGLLAYFVTESALKMFRAASPREKRGTPGMEFRRQLFHMYVGVAVVVAAILLGTSAVEQFIIVALFAGLLAINAKLVGGRIGVFERFLAEFERRKAEFPGRGALFFAVGALFLLSFSLSDGFALAALSVLAVSDGASTMVGVRHGQAKLPWNKRKSWEGMFAFFSTGAVVAYLFIGLYGVLLAALLALVETYDFHIDDNLLIPMAAIAIDVVGHSLGA
ncbi:MAG: phosphatase PAP2 family protein [Candidatus Micrarchaeota archaeon]